MTLSIVSNDGIENLLLKVRRKPGQVIAKRFLAAALKRRFDHDVEGIRSDERQEHHA
jgi:hypothetical protein